jgi:hypothetical protein
MERFNDGFDLTYVTIDEWVPQEEYHPGPEKWALVDGVLGTLHGNDVIWREIHEVAVIWRDILRKERMRTAAACQDRRAGHLAIYARKGRQRRKNWKKVVRVTVEEIRKAFLTDERLR